MRKAGVRVQGTGVRKSKGPTRRQYEDWFKGEQILWRAMLHVQQCFAFHPGDFPLGFGHNPHTYLHMALWTIAKEKREAAR
jgi:hypothetical protein